MRAPSLLPPLELILRLESHSLKKHAMSNPTEIVPQGLE
jgi:hypothetical protein